MKVTFKNSLRAKKRFYRKYILPVLVIVMVKNGNDNNTITKHFNISLRKLRKIKNNYA